MSAHYSIPDGMKPGTGPGLTRYLVVMTANIYRLILEIHGMQERTPAALQAVFKKYDSELLET